jgi:hypothetical protein
MGERRRVCSGQRTEERGKEVVYKGCTHAVGDKKSKKAEGTGNGSGLMSAQAYVDQWKTHRIISGMTETELHLNMNRTASA